MSSALPIDGFMKAAMIPVKIIGAEDVGDSEASVGGVGGLATIGDTVGSLLGSAVALLLGC